MSEFWNTRLIYKIRAGSHSYGTNTEDSDEDFRGICIPPLNYFLGLDSFEQKEFKSPNDEVIYSLKKFVSLALNNNPNIIDVLFADDESIIYINQFGEELRSLKTQFLSKRIRKTYGGYAYSQLKKMMAYKKDAIGKRKENIEKWGYDVKNALHLIRLLRMGIEILQTGQVMVYRPDREELLDIKRGKYTLKQIQDMVEEYFIKLDEVYEESYLPINPNYNLINNWLIDVHKRSLDLEWET